jgi:hypothetical protein
MRRCSIRRFLAFKLSNALTTQPFEKQLRNRYHDLTWQDILRDQTNGSAKLSIVKVITLHYFSYLKVVDPMADSSAHEYLKSVNLSFPIAWAAEFVLAEFFSRAAALTNPRRPFMTSKSSSFISVPITTKATPSLPVSKSDSSLLSRNSPKSLFRSGSSSPSGILHRAPSLSSEDSAVSQVIETENPFEKVGAVCDPIVEATTPEATPEGSKEWVSGAAAAESTEKSVPHSKLSMPLPMPLGPAMHAPIARRAVSPKGERVFPAPPISSTPGPLASLSLLKDDWMKILSMGRMQKFSSGDIIIHAGSKQDKIYQIVFGTVVASRDDAGSGRLLRQMTSGETFGELSFLMDGIGYLIQLT